MNAQTTSGTGSFRNSRAVIPEQQRMGNRLGFSLLELVIAFSMLSLLTVFGSISLMRAAPKFRLHRAAWEVNSCLNWARYKSIYSGKKIKTVFEKDRFSFFTFDTPQNSWLPIQTHIVEGVILSANNSPIFHPAGTVSNLATILIGNSAGGYKITLAISGRIKLTQVPPDQTARE